MSTCNLKLGQYIKTHKKRKGNTRALIVENMQNCFFGKGSMAFMSKNSKEEKELVYKINRLINFVEKDEKYALAGKSGKTLKKKNPLQKSDYDTGARKKYYFDMIIFTQIANPPDHFTFASHHFLNNPEVFKPFASVEKGVKFIKSKNKLKMGKNKQLLLPDYSITDGSDSYLAGGKKVKGIDFHHELDLSSLYRPNDNLHPNVFINAPRYYNRGYVLTKGNDVSSNHSAFYNSNKKTTGLASFLKCNGVNSITICGMGREEHIHNTIIDSLNIRSIKERMLVYDATKPINIDLTKFKKKPKMLEEMRKEDIEGNDFVFNYIKKGVKVVDSINMFSAIKNLDKLVNQNKMSMVDKLSSMFENSAGSAVTNSDL